MLMEIRYFIQIAFAFRSQIEEQIQYAQVGLKTETISKNLNVRILLEEGKDGMFFFWMQLKSKIVFWNSKGFKFNRNLSFAAHLKQVQHQVVEAQV